LFLIAAVTLAVAPDASAQFFRRASGRPRPPMKKPSALISRQAPAKVDRSFESAVNPSNSRVLISLSKQRAYLIAGDQVYIDSPVSTGKRAGSTPTGTFRITEKDPDHRSSLYGDFVDSRGRVVRSGISTRVDSAPSGTRYVGAPMKWFMRLTSGGVGMHVGILPGYPASHGCIRLPADIAPLIYQKVKLGTPVTIEA
jgi:lipoprotein-anchoring transpeptidase ErfK/SrfK